MTNQDIHTTGAILETSSELDKILLSMNQEELLELHKAIYGNNVALGNPSPNPVEETVVKQETKSFEEELENLANEMSPSSEDSLFG